MADFLDNLIRKHENKNPWPKFMSIGARRRGGNINPNEGALEERRAEGRAIASMLPPGIGPAAALGASLAYEGGFKPIVENIPAVNSLMPESLRYTPGISSKASFLDGLRRALETGRGAVEQNYQDLGGFLLD